MPVSTTQPDSQSDCQLTANAVVVSTRPDGLVDLEFSSMRQCAACAGTCLWKRLQAARLDRLPVRHRLLPGAEVTVALPGSRVVAAALLLYGVPLAAILGGAAVGALLTGTDFGTLVGAFAALGFVVAGFGVLRRRIEQATLSSLIVTPRS